MSYNPFDITVGDIASSVSLGTSLPPGFDRIANNIKVGDVLVANAKAVTGQGITHGDLVENAVTKIAQDDEIAQSKRFREAEQCWLAYNWKLLSRRAGMKSVMSPATGRGAASPWKNFVSIEGAAHGRTNPMMKLFGASAAPLFNVRAEHLSALVPTIKLWYDDQRIYFPDHQPEVNDIFKDGPSRGAGVGLKSVTFEQSMKHSQEEGTKNILTRIVIYFRDAATFAQSQGTDARAFSWYDLLLMQGKDTGEGGDASTTRVFSSDWSLRMEVGWADPSRVLLQYGKDIRQAVNKIRQTLLLAKYKHAFKFNQDGSLELQLDLIGKFEDVAGDKIGANVFGYDSRHTQTLESIKITKKEDRMSDSAERDEFEKKYNLGAHAIDINTWSGGAQHAYMGTPRARAAAKQAQREDPDGYARWEAQRNYEDEIEGHEDTINRAKAVIVENLFRNGHIKYVDVGNSEMKVFTGDDAGVAGVGGTLAQIIERSMKAPDGQINANDADFLRKFGDDDHAFNEATPLTHGGSVKKIGQANDRHDAYDEEYSDTMAQIGQAKVEGNQEKVDQLTKDWESRGAHDTAGITPPRDAPDTHRIYYFYLGSLIDIAMQNYVSKKNEYVHSTYAFGELPIVDLKALSIALAENKGPSGVKRLDGTITQIPIANLAISWKSFSIWYLNEIIRKEVVQMSVAEFIDSVVQKFVPTLCEECFGVSVTAASQPKISQVSFSLPAKTTKPHPVPGMQKRGALVVGDDTHIKSAGVQRLSAGFKIDSPSTPIDKPPENYIFIFGTSHAEIDMKGNADEDIKNGIYHFRVGADSGILKSVEFVEQPDKRAETAAIDSQSEYHTRRYNANLRLVGNVLLKPADLIYIEPFVHGSFSQGGLRFKSEKQFMDASGLGGYHIVKKISHTIKAGVYDTEVEAWSQTMKHNLNPDPDDMAEAYEKARADQMNKGGATTAAEQAPNITNVDDGQGDYTGETFAVDDHVNMQKEGANSFKWSDLGAFLD